MCNLYSLRKGPAAILDLARAMANRAGNVEPGGRAYHPAYFAAFLLDPDDNNIEAVLHGEADRSAPSVLVRF